MAVSAGDSVKMLDVSLKCVMETQAKRNLLPKSLDFTADDSKLVLGSTNGQVVVWDVKNGKLQMDVFETDDSLSLSYTCMVGNFLYCASLDGGVLSCFELIFDEHPVKIELKAEVTQVILTEDELQVTCKDNTLQYFSSKDF